MRESPVRQKKVVSEPKMARIVVRRMKSSDSARVSAIYEETFGSSASFVETDKRKVVVSTVRGEVIGFVSFDIEDDEVHINNVGVTKQHRRAGACTKMVGWVIENLPRYRRVKLSLFSAPDPPSAVRCYTNLGLKSTDGSSDLVYTLPATKQGKPLVRWMKKTEIEQVIAINDQCFPSDSDYANSDDFIGRKVLVATIFGRVAGYTICQLREKSTVEITRVGVVEPSRRVGAAAAMTRFLLSKMDSLKCSRITIDVGDSESARLCYLKQGFRRIRGSRSALELRLAS